MTFITFLLGVVLGMMVREIKFVTIKEIEKFKKENEVYENANFIEPTSFREKFDDASSLDDLLK
jgi:hypothetical protein